MIQSAKQNADDVLKGNKQALAEVSQTCMTDEKKFHFYVSKYKSKCVLRRKKVSQWKFDFYTTKGREGATHEKKFHFYITKANAY